MRITLHSIDSLDGMRGSFIAEKEPALLSTEGGNAKRR
jgi:hypothetical protein